MIITRRETINISTCYYYYWNIFVADELYLKDVSLMSSDILTAVFSSEPVLFYLRKGYKML